MEPINEYQHLFYVAENGDEIGTRKYVMSAPKEGERVEWLRVLKQLFASTESRVHPASLLEGYLFKKGKKTKKSKKKGEEDEEAETKEERETQGRQEVRGET